MKIIKGSGSFFVLLSNIRGHYSYWKLIQFVTILSKETKHIRILLNLGKDWRYNIWIRKGVFPSLLPQQILGDYYMEYNGWNHTSYESINQECQPAASQHSICRPRLYHQNDKTFSRMILRTGMGVIYPPKASHFHSKFYTTQNLIIKRFRSFSCVPETIPLLDGVQFFKRPKS